MVSLLYVGKSFSNYDTLIKAIAEYQQVENVELWVRDSRTVEAAAKRARRKCLNPLLVYAELTYSCVFGGRKQTDQNRIHNQTSAKGCPYKVRLSTSSDGQSLVVKEINTKHNHDPALKLHQDSRRNNRRGMRKRRYKRSNSCITPSPTSSLEWFDQYPRTPNVSPNSIVSPSSVGGSVDIKNCIKSSTNDPISPNIKKEYSLQQLLDKDTPEQQLSEFEYSRPDGLNNAASGLVACYTPNGISDPSRSCSPADCGFHSSPSYTQFSDSTDSSFSPMPIDHIELPPENPVGVGGILPEFPVIDLSSYLEASMSSLPSFMEQDNPPPTYSDKIITHSIIQHPPRDLNVSKIKVEQTAPFVSSNSKSTNVFPFISNSIVPTSQSILVNPSKVKLEPPSPTDHIVNIKKEPASETTYILPANNLKIIKAGDNIIPASQIKTEPASSFGDASSSIVQQPNKNRILMHSNNQVRNIVNCTSSNQMVINKVRKPVKATSSTIQCNGQRITIQHLKPTNIGPFSTSNNMGNMASNPSSRVVTTSSICGGGSIGQNASNLGSITLGNVVSNSGNISLNTGNKGSTTSTVGSFTGNVGPFTTTIGSFTGNKTSHTGNFGAITSGNAKLITGNTSPITCNIGSITGNTAPMTGNAITGNTGPITGNTAPITGNVGSISYKAKLIKKSPNVATLKLIKSESPFDFKFEDSLELMDDSFSDYFGMDSTSDELESAINEFGSNVPDIDLLECNENLFCY